MDDEVRNSEERPEDRRYTFEEAVRDSTEYFRGDKMAARNFVNKYALKDSFGNIYESNPNQMHQRIAREIERIEKEKGYENPLAAEEVYSALEGFNRIIPQGSPMSGIGNNYQVVSLSNCFVIGNESDSYGGIMRTDEEQVQLMKRRGGVGHDLSHLRPQGTPVMNSAQTSTGVVPFMERYSNSTREVAQDGRRGALMLSISIKHPDAEGFIDAKTLEGKVTGANVSVRVDDEFMRAVQNGGNYLQQFPIDSDNPTFTKEVNARELWGKIIHNAWKSAEPGVLFWDTVIRESVPDSYADLGFKTTSTNPCGEIPLCPYDSCRLLALNLAGYVNNPFTPEAEFDRGRFVKDAGLAQRIMDDIVDLEIEKVDQILAKIDRKDPEEAEIRYVERNLWKKIREKSIQGRRTGIGITGEGDMLASLGMRYASDEAIEFSTEVHRTLALEVYRGSVQLAKERGAFPIYDAEREKDNPFIQRLISHDPQLGEDMNRYGRRNIALLTIAPTGTVSQMSQTSSGVEPAFQVIYDRRRKVNPNDQNVNVDFKDEVGDSWERYTVFHHGFKKWLEVNGYDVEEVESIANESLRDSKKAKELEKIIMESPYYKATANDIDWVSKVKLQGSIQKYVDHSISVTVNVPENTSEELIGQVYQTAWASGCKGITVYRDKSRDGVLLTREGGLEKMVGTMDNPLDIPGIVPAVKLKQPSPFGNLHVTVVTDPARNYAPIEVFGTLGNAGSVEAADVEMAGRTASLWLRHGGPIEDYIEQIKNIGSGVSSISRDGSVQSLPMAFARALQRYDLTRKHFDMEEVMLGKVDFDEVYAQISDALRTGSIENGNGKKEKIKEKPQKSSAYSQGKCPDCQTSLTKEEGCQKCKNCGYEKCG